MGYYLKAMHVKLLKNNLKKNLKKLCNSKKVCIFAAALEMKQKETSSLTRLVI